MIALCVLSVFAQRKFGMKSRKVLDDGGMTEDEWKAIYEASGRGPCPADGRYTDEDIDEEVEECKEDEDACEKYYVQSRLGQGHKICRHSLRSRCMRQALQEEALRMMQRILRWSNRWNCHCLRRRGRIFRRYQAEESTNRRKVNNSADYAMAELKVPLSMRGRKAENQAQTCVCATQQIA
jgi:hypothetical protein